jgi:hypothetical protein
MPTVIAKPHPSASPQYLAKAIRENNSLGLIKTSASARALQILPQLRHVDINQKPTKEKPKSSILKECR